MGQHTNAVYTAYWHGPLEWEGHIGLQSNLLSKKDKYFRVPACQAEYLLYLGQKHFIDVMTK